MFEKDRIFSEESSKNGGNGPTGATGVPGVTATGGANFPIKCGKSTVNLSNASVNDGYVSDDVIVSDVTLSSAAVAGEEAVLRRQFVVSRDTGGRSPEQVNNFCSSSSSSLTVAIPTLNFKLR